VITVASPAAQRDGAGQCPPVASPTLQLRVGGSSGDRSEQLWMRATAAKSEKDRDRENNSIRRRTCPSAWSLHSSHPPRLPTKTHTETSSAAIPAVLSLTTSLEPQDAVPLDRSDLPMCVVGWCERRCQRWVHGIDICSSRAHKDGTREAVAGFC
jgi:hypothetical protein